MQIRKDPRGCSQSGMMFTVGEDVYRLDLPDTSHLYPIFHVSILKKHIRDSSISSTGPPELDEKGQFRIEPYKILDRRVVNRQNKHVTQLLVRWTNLYETNDTWEDYIVLRGQLPNFDPWGQGSSPTAGIVIVQRRRTQSEEEIGESESQGDVK
ncbi:uncharacterized protein LOC120163520 [Hibiscus syriacus]|uniref:uncharacterized protein LOC120163520 n=1 Tax=Hibiscus syriacus TaxID=106335 RepID=UPI0019243DED|nr:uncharacterized protein LOC120163520 [Hibiscus syriacus]